MATKKTRKRVVRKTGALKRTAARTMRFDDSGSAQDDSTPVAPVAAPARSLRDRVLDVMPPVDFGEPERLTAEEIASRLTGDWTPAELEVALGALLDSHEIASDSTEDLTVYYLIPPTPAPPVDEEQLLTDARTELARIMAQKDRPRATRSLECVLTPDEKSDMRLRSGELRAQEVTELREVERLAGLLKAAKERAAALASLKDHQQDVAAAGREYREVECHRIPLWHHGLAVTLRADTGEEIEREPLEAAEERQGALYPTGTL